jgi:membrane protein YqaA with SNARE-associated domain
VFDQLARPVIDFYGYGQKFAAFQDLYARWGLWVILIKGMTPIPYKIVTIASGAAHFNFAVFMAASLATRGARFFLVAGLLKAFGPPIRDFIERRLTLVTSVAAVGVVGGFLALRLL